MFKCILKRIFATRYTCSDTDRSGFAALYAIDVPIDWLRERITVIQTDSFVGHDFIRQSITVNIHKTFRAPIFIVRNADGYIYTCF